MLLTVFDVVCSRYVVEQFLLQFIKIPHLFHSLFQPIQKALKPLSFKALAEKEGFEPSHRLSQSTPLAGEPLTATWVFLHIKLAEREGFEPPVPFGITGFQDQRHQPLGHLSLLNTSKRNYNNNFALCQYKYSIKGKTNTEKITSLRLPGL